MRKILREEKAQAIAEYALVAFFLIFICWVSVKLFSDSLGSYINKVADKRTGTAGILP